MDLLELVILGLAGLFGGVLAGLFGVGGGTVFVPALVYAAGWDIREAVAASLVIIVFSALSGTLRSMRSEVPVNWRAATLFSLTVPLLILGFGLDPKTAISTSLVVTLLVGVLGAAGYFVAGFDRLSGLPPLIVGSMLGAWPGVRIRERLGEALLQRAFAAYMVLVAVLIFLDTVNGS